MVALREPVLSCVPAPLCCGAALTVTMVASPTPSPSPTASPLPPPTSAIDFAVGTWSYRDDNVDLTSQGWETTSFALTSAWKIGQGILGFGTFSFALRTTLLGGSATARTPTFYLRRSVTITGDPSSTYVGTLSLKVDDGCVAFVNGVEVGRVNVAASGAVTHASYAAAVMSTEADAVLVRRFLIPAGVCVLPRACDIPRSARCTLELGSLCKHALRGY
jgi:hypothetical protein